MEKKIKFNFCILEILKGLLTKSYDQAISKQNPSTYPQAILLPDPYPQSQTTKPIPQIFEPSPQSFKPIPQHPLDPEAIPQRDVLEVLGDRLE
jgi:hypothetical protein